MPVDHLSYCRICAAACGIVVTVDGDRVVKVRGDADHPVSRGYVCPKGRGLADWHHDGRRLDHPRLGGREVSWTELFADLGPRLAGIVEATGPDAVALYLATGLAYDSAGQVAAAQFLPSLGSSAFLTAVTVDNAPVLVAAELVTGQAMANPVWDPQSPGLLLLVGTNPVISHGYGTALPDPIRHLREYRERGGTVWVLDPRRSETAANADRHVAVRPGSDVAVLGAVAAALFDAADEDSFGDDLDPADVATLQVALADFTPERAASVADVPVGEIDALIEAVLANRGRLAVHCGTGVMMSPDGVLAEWLRWVILIASGSIDRPGGMFLRRGAIHQLRRADPALAALLPQPRPAAASRPELPRVLGQVPAVALVDEIEAGHIRALLVTGGNPLTAFPQPDRVRAALEQLDVLAVVDVQDNPLTGLATHVLPATGQLERADVTLAELTALRSGLQFTPAVVDPVAERRPVWWILASLAQAMGVEALGGIDPSLIGDADYLRGVLDHSTLDADAVFAAGPRGIETPTEHGWVAADLLPGGRWQIAPAPLLERLHMHTDPPAQAVVLATRREMAWSNSVAYGARVDAPQIRVHPDTATPDDRGRLTVATSHGRVTATAVADSTVRPGVVSLTHGHPEANPGTLTDDTEGVDPLTTMPLASGLPLDLGGGATSASETQVS